MLTSNPQPQEAAQAEMAEKLGLSAAARSRRRRNRLLQLVALVAVLAAGYVLYARHSASQSAISYVTAPAVTADITVKVAATGTIAPVTEVDVSSQLSGIIAEVKVDENDAVKKGDVLATLDATRLRTSRDGTAAKLAIAQAAVDQAQSTLAEQSQISDRQKALAGRGLTPTQTADSAAASVVRARAALESAEAQVLATKADLATIDTDLAHTIITAPIDGVILKRSIEPGQTVASSLQAPVLFQIAGDLRELQLEANVDEADIGQVKEGQIAVFTVDAYRDRFFPALIARLSFSPQTVNGVVTYQATLLAPNPDLKLRPGMTATAYVTVASYPQALAVPNEVLRYRPPVAEAARGFSITNLFVPHMPRQQDTKPTGPGNRQIYVLKDGKPEAMTVEVGASDGKLTLVKSDVLKPGDPVIISQKQGTP